MKTNWNKIKWWTVLWIWIIFCGLTGLMLPVMAQVVTNSPPAPGPDNTFPIGKEAIWYALIPPVTFTITWLVGKIPPLPKEILPWITPLVGICLGLIVNWAAKQDLSWWSTAGFGAISVAIYEAAKGLSKAGPTSALTPNNPIKNPEAR